MSTSEASPFVSIVTASTAAVAGDFVAFPIDTLKIRMQMHPGRMVNVARKLWKGGLPMLFRGVGASSFRQLTYGGMRLSIYEPIRNLITGQSTRNKDEPISLAAQITAGALSGAISSAVMCPADVVKIRLQGGEAEYRGVADALVSIVRHEGVASLWRGVGPTSTRASVVAAMELGLYDNTKFYLIEKHGFEGTPVYVAASLFATMGAILVSFPIDVSKTIMINQGVKGVSCSEPQLYPPFRNMGHCLFSLFKERGFLGMYNGCLPSFGRSITCNLVMFLVYEELKSIFWKDLKT